MPLCPQIVITPITVTSTGMSQTSIVPIVTATTEEIDELQVEIDSVETAVNGKNHIYRQTTAPDGTVYPLTEGDVWFDTDDGNKQYYWTGTAWVSVQDAAIAAAQTTADGKNKIYRQTTMPTTGPFVEGDLWFDTDDDNKFYRYTSGAFSAFSLGNNAIADLSATKLTAGTIDASVITVSNINAGNISTGSLASGRIAAGTIVASQIAVATITATQIASGTITASQIASFTITADEIAASTITAAEIEVGSITVDRLAVGTLTGFTIQTSGSTRIRMQDSTNSINFIVSGTQRAHLVPAGTNGVIMHYGTSPNSAATSYPLVFVSSGSVVVAQSSTKFLEVNSLGVVANGNFYSTDATYIQDSSTTSNVYNARIDSGDGRLRRSTFSSARFKEAIADIETVADLAPSKLLSVPVRVFKFKADYLDATDNRSGMVVPGLIAEEVAEHYPIAADRGNDGLVENWNERFVIPGMLALIQDLHGRVATLEGKP